MAEDFRVTFEFEKAQLGTGCDVIAVFPGGHKKRIAFGTEDAARDWVRRGASRWLKKRGRKPGTSAAAGGGGPDAAGGP